MSILASFITRNFAIMKSDTMVTFNKKPLPDPQHKIMKLIRNEKRLLIGFCGTTYFNGKDTFDHIKNEERQLFGLYDSVEAIGNYLKDLLSPQLEKSAKAGEIDNNKTLIIHIVSKMNHDLGRGYICKVIIDYRWNPDTVTCGLFSYDEKRGYQIIWSGADSAQRVFYDCYMVQQRKLNYDSCEETLKDFNTVMKSAIVADPGCGEPIDTFCYCKK